MEDLIFIMGGGIVRDKTGRWCTPNFREGDNFGVTGSHLRVIAAATIFNKNPGTMILASAGKDPYASGKRPTVAEVIKRELVDLGVTKTKIFEDRHSRNTYEQLVKLTKLIKSKKYRKIIMITNDFHVGRTTAMINYRPEFKILKVAANRKLLSAEKILIKENPQKWNKVIARAYRSKRMQQRIALEKKGIKDIISGKYKIHD